MAEPVTGPGNKPGNTRWIACPACKTEFPVSPALLARADVAKLCPACHHEFKVEGK